MSDNLFKLKKIVRAIEGGRLSKAVSECLALENVPSAKYIRLQELSNKIKLNGIEERKETIAYESYLKVRQSLSKELLILIEEIKSEVSFSSINNTRTIGLPNKNFVGREEIIKELFENFQNGERIQVLHGISGIGKTRIALEYAYESEKKGMYSELIWWVQSENQAVLENDFCKLMERLNLERTQDSDKYSQITKIINWLEKHDNWLLVFDNARDIENIKKVLPLRRGNIIVTSTNPNWSGGELADMQLLEVKRIDDVSAAKLVEGRSGNTLSSTNIKNQIDIFEGYPLILELIGAYFEDGLNSRRGESLKFFLQEGFSELSIENKLNKIIWSIFDELEEEIPRFSLKWLGLGAIINIIVWLAPHQIPRYLFEKYVDFMDTKGIKNYKPLNLFERILFRFFERKLIIITDYQNNYLKQFAKKSIITDISEDYLNTHSIIQHHFLRKFEVGDKIKKKMMIMSMCKLLSEEFYSGTLKTERIEKNHILLPHIMSFLDKTMTFGVKINPLIRLSKQIADFLFQQEQLSLADKYARYAYELEKEMNGKASFDTLKQKIATSIVTINLDNFSLLIPELRTQKEYQLHEEIYLEGLTKVLKGDLDSAYDLVKNSIKCLNEQHKKSNKFHYYLLGGMVSYRKDKKEGEFYFKKAKEILENKFGKESEEYGMFFYYQGMAFFNSVKGLEETRSQDIEMIEKAFDFYEKAYDIFVGIGGESHFMAIMGMIEKGVVAGNWNYDDILEICYNRAQKQEKLFEEKMGENHLIMAEKNLLYAYQKGNQGDYKEAIFHLDKAKKICVKNFGTKSNYHRMVLIDELLEKARDLDS